MSITRRVCDEVRRTLSPFPRVVVAVSGGLDSMTLLDAIASTVPERVGAVAVFDHRTGSAAQRAVAHVRESARILGLPLRVGRAARGTRPSEAAWRDARWTFL
ncbi:MAG TPA: ATP-binding protein, partial [Gemmatimonadales bacterium]|nr:ATP-binding protein [Gemmatimonadales bacterium]